MARARYISGRWRRHAHDAARRRGHAGPAHDGQQPGADSKPSAFPLNVCEATLAADAKEAHRRRQGAAAAEGGDPQRIVMLADTGCRLKKADNAWQSCNDKPRRGRSRRSPPRPRQLKPDLVMHIGDYHYRENACPADIAGCKDSPWGYGWDTWEADLFKPAAPLLAAAPWIVVRGNHEECARAGQGWFRLLDTQAYSAKRSCDDPANDSVANYTAPYAVPLGGDTQVIVFDSATHRQGGAGDERSAIPRLPGRLQDRGPAGRQGEDDERVRQPPPDPRLRADRGRTRRRAAMRRCCRWRRR
jgi:hypothetical protein